MPNIKDFTDDHIEYLTHMAHHVHGPTDFDAEVQKHLDRLYASKNTPKDPLASPADDANAKESHQDQAIANVSDFGNSPNVLSPPKPVKPIPSMTPPPSAAGLS